VWPGGEGDLGVENSAVDGFAALGLLKIGVEDDDGCSPILLAALEGVVVGDGL